MILYFRTLHGRLEIRNFSSLTSSVFNTQEKFRISARPCNIFYVQWISSREICCAIQWIALFTFQTTEPGVVASV